jgi:hypothetical protein
MKQNKWFGTCTSCGGTEDQHPHIFCEVYNEDKELYID